LRRQRSTEPDGRGCGETFIAAKNAHICAGMKPGRVPVAVIRAMNEIGIRMADQKSKGLADVPVNEIDLVVSFGEAHKQCANLPGRIKIKNWPVAKEFTNKQSDGENLDAVRHKRDDIEKRVFALFMDYWRNVS